MTPINQSDLSPPFSIYVIGSLTLDYFINLPLNANKKNVLQECYDEQEAYFFRLGQKVFPKVSNIHVGGGAMNCALNFRILDQECAIFPISAIGENNEWHRSTIMDTMIYHNISNTFIQTVPHMETSLSLIMGSLEEKVYNPVVIALRRASAHIILPDIVQGNLLYISSIQKKLWKTMLQQLKNWTDFKMKAMNPNPEQLLEWAKTKNNIGIHVLSINTKEMVQSAQLLGLEEKKGKHTLSYEDKSYSLWDYFTMMSVFNVRYVVVTDGKSGAYAYDGEDIYFAQAPNVKALSTLGAGDSFASTLCYGLIKNISLQQSLALALTQAANVVKHISTTNGLKDFDSLMKISKNLKLNIKRL